jgi:hypothetical protein
VIGQARAAPLVKGSEAIVPQSSVEQARGIQWRFGKGAWYMGSVTPEDARQYLERWKLVEEREILELRNTSMEIKARQLSLMASRNLFREDPDRERGVREVQARWAQLRKALGG